MLNTTETEIPALSVAPDWAYRIANGSKTLETRSWRTRYRGELLICAAKRGRRAGFLPGRHGRSRPPAVPVQPGGVAVAIVELVDIRPMRREDEAAACVAFDAKLYVWELRNVRRVKPAVVIGRLGLFRVKRSIIEPIETAANNAIAWDSSRIDAHDKRKAAMHEAGHLTVAIAEGAWAEAYIWHNATAGEFENTWLGQCRAPRLSKIAGAAGRLAEEWEDGEDPDLFRQTIEDAAVFWIDEMSASDLSAFPHEEEQREEQVLQAFCQAFELLKKHERFFRWAVGDLIENSLIDAKLAVEEFERLAAGVANG